jgi:protein ImuA
LQTLRHAVAEIEANGARRDPGRRVRFGVPPLDRMLGGGLAVGAVHELAPAAPAHLGAASGFVAALAALAIEGGRQAVWLQPELAALEAGRPYGPGLDALGLPMHRLILVRVAHARDVPWAMEEALKCRALAAVIAEFADGAADLTMTRRLTLAAGEGDTVGLLLRHRRTDLPSSAMTRWEVASAPGERDRFGGLGRPALLLSLVRNRRGPPGRWLLSWDHHAHAFVSAALPVDLAAPPGDGSHHASRVRANASQL